MRVRTGLMGALSPENAGKLRELGTQVAFASGERIFEEGDKAERFWVIHTGSVTLEQHVPGRSDQVVETIGHGELLGWSWLFPPYTWHLSGETGSPVRAVEFDAAEVRALCDRDRELGYALALAVGETVSYRLQRSRSRLIDMYGARGGT